MKMKVIISLAVIGVALAAVATMPAQTYVPSADELSQVIGGDWTTYKECASNLRCTGTEVSCGDHLSLCASASPGDACQSESIFWDRDGCTSDTTHKCKYDECATKILCTRTNNCECTVLTGYEDLRCISDLVNPYNEVYPCTDQEM
ncbi:MAG: hypothetical protein OEW48_05425 [Phycisphaerae bacterium]|nr:hypothetical protein [Phycisphaerae bacterium]